MVALKAAEIERYITNPPDAVNLILVYGPDTGLVNERTHALISNAAAENDDPFSQVKLDAADIASDPSRLIDEALTIPLFGGRRTIWVRENGTKSVLPAVEPLLKNNDFTAFIVIEAGDLKKTAGLRKKFEASKTAIAIPCFADTAKDVDRLIDDETNSAGLQISKEARMTLHTLLGADRIASRGELKKLCLYAMKDNRIEVHHVEEIIGDASAFAMDELIDAAALGDTVTLDHGLERLSASGTDAGMIASQALRHFQMLHLCRLKANQRIAVEDVIGGMRPPIFWKRRSKIVRQVEIWNEDYLERALTRLNDAVRESRFNASLSAAIVSHTLLAIAQVAKAANRRR
ncbi:DNA polymerase III subunit delta [Pseudovibrio sp. Tun.PSC04-5.I4]|uniref:DNA polymerase III subunit delta n=1 Tax=Pseudovibrio sp. Tun.PSC04-5.I4 TaxID=1798213 RepID=UPI0008847CE8|nr:DNA polymerase III subunit delta [Pseudovibrio sp. Tun.PSC04-5.I4]SDR26655.1 DNA polymerase III, delta subunit [Pseudovibrio sp. Tun.PSC04-5.I4]